MPDHGEHDGQGDMRVEGLPAWARTWRDGVAPLLSGEGLAALRDALMTDDARLQQGVTTTPPLLVCVQKRRRRAPRRAGRRAMAP